MSDLSDLYFEGQMKGEKVMALRRRHFIFLCARLFLPLVIGAVSFYVFLLINDWLHYLSLVIFLMCLFLVFRQVVSWYYSFYILTNLRLRYVSQIGFFRRQTLDLRLTEFSGVSCFSNGFLATLFSFGDVVIDSDVGQLTIYRISQVDKFYDVIQQQLNYLEKNSEKY